MKTTLSSTLESTAEELASVTAEDVKFFNDQGYLLPKGKVFPEAKFKKLKECFEKLLANLPPGKRPETMDVPHFMHPELFEWLFADEVLDLIEPILGPDIALYSSHFICKPKGDGKRVPWHEDSAYWKGKLDPMEVVTVWLAIDESTPENGCMYVIPKTHREGKQGYSTYAPVDSTTSVFGNEIIKEERNDALAIPCILEEGQCSLHDAKLMHGSPPNKSQKRRCGYTMRYTSARSSLADDVWPWHNLYLARGRNLRNLPYADPTRAHPEVIAARNAFFKKLH